MTANNLLILVLLTIVKSIAGIWPPPYSINLSDEGTFQILEIFGDNLHEDNDEMIKKTDVKKFKLEKDDRKYYKLHTYAKRYDKRDMWKEYNSKYKLKLIEEINFDLNNSAPSQVGFVDNDGHFIQIENKNVFYSNNMVKDLLKKYKLHKREENKTNTTNDYDYSAMKAEYFDEIEPEEQQNDTFTVKNENSTGAMKKSLKKIVDFKTLPRNCTAEEMKGIGIGAMKCFWIDLKKTETKEQKWKLFRRILKLVIIWFGLYLVIAIPCWCQKGWCCCCFRCRCCKPRKTIDEAKNFLLNNPPGVYKLKDKSVLKYEPTEYEKYAYDKLNRALLKI